VSFKPVGPIVETDNPTIAPPQKEGSDRALLPERFLAVQPPVL
jgi:hypothetical protein